MLTIEIPAVELWDERKLEFVQTKKQTLLLEHSLVSLSKWESKWCKPFLSKQEKTYEETIDYIKCMTITQNVKDETYDYLTISDIKRVNDYIEAPMTATIVPNVKNGPANKETVTSELIYYWMVSLNIPFKCEKWHLNRLLKLIEVCNFKNTPPKKMSKKEIMNRNRAMNEARKQQLNTKG